MSKNAWLVNFLSGHDSAPSNQVLPPITAAPPPFPHRSSRLCPRFSEREREFSLAVEDLRNFAAIA
jgi:hypothetical protein